MNKNTILLSIVMICLSFVLVSNCYSENKPFAAKVVYVFDGDTFAVHTDNKRDKIRLWGVDCPEREQPYSEAAKKYLEKLILGKTVEIKTLYRDDYNRSVAHVLFEKININELLIKKGLAWVHPYYCNRDICELWSKFENSARKEKRGLWGDGNPTPPWVYKSRKRF